MSKIPMVFIHHANQLIITDGYIERDGLSRITDGYRRVLDVHREYRVPMALHLSGTLVEALAWHQPHFLTYVRELVGEGIVTLLGGTYSEPIMTEADPEANIRQISVMAELLERHLDVHGGALPTAWLPERVWHPELQKVLTEPGLPGRGFRRIVVDDRLLAPVRPAPEEPAFYREAVDCRGPFFWPIEGPPECPAGLTDPRLLTPRTVADPRPLTFVPLSSHLRYLVPPPTPEHLRFLDELVEDAVAASADADSLLLAFGDDVERCAGVGGWEQDHGRYADLVRRVADDGRIRPVHLDDWLDDHEHTLAEGPPPEAGSYYELEVQWQAGREYHGWSRTPEWLPYRKMLGEVGSAVRHARADGADGELVGVAERLLMLGQHETAWRDRDTVDSSGELAAWVRAGCSHARLGYPVLEAARWSADGGCAPAAELRDVDGDGTEELVMRHRDIWAIASPRHGGRLTLMVHRRAGTEPGAAVTVGNPCDHWNLLENLHQFMEVPPGHPGSLTDPEAPDREWTVHLAEHGQGSVLVELRPTAGEHGEVRQYMLHEDIPAFVACIRQPTPGLTENTMIPDYLGVLRDGSGELRDTGGQRWRGWRWRGRECWLGFDPGQAELVTPRWFAAGHSCAVALRSHNGHVDLLVGAGAVDDALVAGWMERARSLLHCSAEHPTSVARTIG